MLKYLLEKEFKQIVRNSFLPKLIIMFPLVALLVFPWAANFEIKNIQIDVVDQDHSTYAMQLIQKIDASDYFVLVDHSPTYEHALENIELSRADIILEIPQNFERDLMNKAPVKVFVAANAVDATKAGLGASYLAQVVNDFSSNIRLEHMPSVLGMQPNTIDIRTRHLFNPHLKYNIFMVPAIIVMLMTLLCGFLPALNIVGEKESGTMEQMNVSPVSKTSFILSKLIPYWIIGFIILTNSFVITYFVYDLTPLGNLSTIYLFASVYILTVSGFGLVISNNSGTMQQAMFVMFFFLLILILLSGLFTPIENMPQWAQYLTHLNPLKYFMQVMRSVYLKGSALPDLKLQMFALGSFALVFNSWAVLSYRKKN